MLNYTEWLQLEGKKKKSQEVSDFIKGKTNKLKIRSSDLSISTGHPEPVSGSGPHDNRPKRQRTRNAQKQAWKKEQE